MIAKAMEKVGNEGVITVEEAKSIETELEIVEGMQFDRGYLSPYFITNAEKMIVELADPYILLHDKKLSSLQEILPLLEAGGAERQAAADRRRGHRRRGAGHAVVNKLRGGLKVAAVKAPGFGDRRKEMLEDIAILTGCKVVSEDLGIKLENVTLDMLGHAKKVRIDKDNTTVIDGAGKKADIQARCAQLRKQIETVTSEYDGEKLQERLAKLSGGVAIIKVGGGTEIEVKERKDRVDDAMHATRAAVEEGIVAGGGVTLLYASQGTAVAAHRQRRPEGRHRHRAPRAAGAGPADLSPTPASTAPSSPASCSTRAIRARATTPQTGTYVDMVKAGHHRSDEGRAPGPAGRGVDRGPADHHRSDGRRLARARSGRIARKTEKQKALPQGRAFLLSVWGHFRPLSADCHPERSEDPCMAAGKAPSLRSG